MFVCGLCKGVCVLCVIYGGAVWSVDCVVLCVVRGAVVCLCGLRVIYSAVLCGALLSCDCVCLFLFIRVCVVRVID